MITITKKEEIVLTQIKMFSLEYSDGIPENILKMELGFNVHDLNEILKVLDDENLIEYKDNRIKLIDSNKEINAVNSHKEVKIAELDLKEKNSLDLIKSSVDENNLIPRYILEGKLLYGELKLTNFRMYHILLSLENKGVIKSVKKSDGEYFALV